MNFRRILSKSSLKSSTSGKSLSPSEEVSKLQGEIELLKQNIESLKISVESRDAAIGTIAREKEKIFVELKSAQRTNRNLHQQLIDERDIHAKEKEYLIEEIKRLSKNNHNEINIKQDIPDEVHAPPFCSSWQEELEAKDEVIYNICTKYLKIKSSKQKLRKKLEHLQQQSQKICETVILLLHENRKSLDNVFKKLINLANMPPSSKHFLKLLKINSNLHYENTQLKVRLSLQEISGEHDQKSSSKNGNVERGSITNLEKSERKPSTEPPKGQKKIQRYKSMHSRIFKNHNIEDTKNFSRVHEIFSPHFRRKKKFSSDPCLFGPKL